MGRYSECSPVPSGPDLLVILLGVFPGCLSLDWFSRENLNRKPWFLHVFTIKLVGLSGVNFPIIQFYDTKVDSLDQKD